MSWDITIINGDDENRQPLGAREDVVAAFTRAMPGLVLRTPPTPPQEMLEMMPSLLREAAVNPLLEADYEQSDLSIRFSAFDQPLIRWVNAEIRGNDNPLPILAAICRPQNWSVLDAGDNTVVDLGVTEGSAWDRFRKWRDHAFGGNTLDDSQEL